MAQVAATIPISAIRLSPFNRLEKSNRVTLKMIRAVASRSNIEVKIFINFEIYPAKIKI
jgi:hypothetical protein